MVSTEWPADSVEFCPNSTQASNIFVCGTYHLDQNPTTTGLANSVSPQRQHRRGKCLVFEVDPPGASERTIQKIQEIALPAVLDMKWCFKSQESCPVLGIADSEGNISLHEWQHEQKALVPLYSVSCASSETLCLSLDWSNRLHPTDGLGSLVVSLSSGNLCILRPREQSGLVVTDTWAAHDYEPWIAAWNYWDTNVLYSGGDDLKLKGWDSRQGFAQTIFVNKRFNAGVTTIQSHPYIEHLIAVGSYDDIVQLFDTRKPLVPLAETNVGGGAWRVKWHPSAARQSDLLVACMHGGFKVVRFDLDGLNADSPGQVIKRFDTHTSMGYGVDWSFEQASDNTDNTLVASCSFYDHALYTWNA